MKGTRPLKGVHTHPQCFAKVPDIKHDVVVDEELDRTLTYAGRIRASKLNDAQ